MLEKSAKKQTLVSGVRATGTPHIGNYLGAMKQFIDLQNDYNCFFFIADLHALTTPFVPAELKKNTIELTADYLALGLNTKNVALFLQSQVVEHTELAWILNCITPIGELSRMTQFKDKSGQAGTDSINAGLLNYPVLMAADILLYKPTVVPVGEDQVQHLEMTRVLARKFNNKFGHTFPEPKPLLKKNVMRIKSLLHPEKKMSKTNDEPLYISDSPEIIRKKLKKAVTATDAHGKSEGVDNLFTLLHEFGSADQVKYFDDTYSKNTIKFSELKETLTEDISNHFADFREKRSELLADPVELAEILTAGAEKARKIARQTILEVKERLGLL